MNSFCDVIDAFHGEFAQAIGIEESHARVMKTRKSIPSVYWLRVARAAEERSIEGVTLEVLAELESAKVRAKEAVQ